MIRINLRELEKDVEGGRLARNLVLRDGDSIYVQKDDPNRIFVSGEVRTPGSFSIPDGTTVIAVDTVGAGEGEVVLLLDEGNSARQILGLSPAPVRTLPCRWTSSSAGASSCASRRSISART